VGVVGVPRSGTMVASLLGLHMHLPIADTRTFKTQIQAGKNPFWSAGNRLHDPIRSQGKVLLLEDSAYTGDGLRRACQAFGGKICKDGFRFQNFQMIPAVLYTSKDIACSYVRKIPGHRLFAWNWLNHSALQNTLFDMDGVLCEDPKVSENNEAGYVAELPTLRPLWIPRLKFSGIVTHRLEKRRKITTEWLQRHGVQLDSLVMRPEATCYERRAKKDQDGTWKGKVYAQKPDATLFVESCVRQAHKIWKASRKDVLCPTVDRFFAGSA